MRLVLHALLQGVRIGQLPVAQALIRPRVGLLEVAAVNGVANAIVEGADAQLAELSLAGLAEQGVAGDLPQVPALAVEVDGVADGVLGDLLQGLAQARHRPDAVVAHEVEAEAVHPVVAHPRHARVDHDPLGHGALGRHIVAAGARLDGAVGVEAVVVAGHDPVEHGVRILTRGRGVVVHLVEHHLHPHAVQRAHHVAHRAGAGAAVLVALARVGSLGHHPVIGVVPPVVGVLVGHGGHGRLRAAGGRGGVDRDLGHPLVGPILGDGGHVEDRQQVQGVDARVRQRAQVTGAERVDRERRVGAAQLGRHGGVGRGEVPHVKLVDDAGGVGVDDGAEVLAPGGGLEAALPQVDGDRAARVQGEGRAVGVGDPVELDPAGRGGEDLDLPQVLRTGADLARAHLPPAVVEPTGGQAHGRVLDQGDRPGRVAGLPDQERDGQSGGRPQGEGREQGGPGGGREPGVGIVVPAAVGAVGAAVPGAVGTVGAVVPDIVGTLHLDEVDPQGRRAVARRGGPPPEPIDQRPDLHSRVGGEPPAGGRGGALDDGELPGQELLDVRALQTGTTEVVGGRQRQVAGQLGVGGHELGGDLTAQDERELGPAGSAAQQPALDMDPPIGGGDEPEADGRSAAGGTAIGAHAHGVRHSMRQQVDGPG